MIEIKNPKKPRIAMPIAETLVIVLKSSVVGFFKTNQTRLHFMKKDFVEVSILFII